MTNIDILEKISEVDIMISTRNRRPDLLKTIENLKSSNFPLNQIFIIDDGSTDGTATAVENEFPTVNVFKNEKSKGYIHNRNILLENSTRKYILSLDDDSNFINISDLKFAVSSLEKDKIAGIFAFAIREQLEPVASVPKDVKRPLTYYCKSFTGCGFLFKKGMLNAVGKLKEELSFYGEELDFSIRANQKGYKIITNSSCIVHHRVDHKIRQMNKKDSIKDGKYGANWRNSNQLANHLLIGHLYFPRIIFPLYSFKTIIAFLRISQNVEVIKEAFKIFKQRLKLIDKNEHNRLNLQDFKNFYKQPNHITN